MRVAGHVVREQLPWKSQNLILKSFEESEFSTEKSEKCEFFDEKFFQVLPENFLEQIWAWLRYEKCCSNIAPSNSKKIRVVRHLVREQLLWNSQNLIFKLLKSQNFLPKSLKNVNFFMKSFFKSFKKIFWSRYDHDQGMKDVALT